MKQHELKSLIKKSMNNHIQNNERDYLLYVQKNPTYLETGKLDFIRSTQFARVDKGNHIYLDYTGGNLYPLSQLQYQNEMLENGVFGNPHSSNPSSKASTVMDEGARAFVAEFFNADPEEYTVIFSNNASGALKLVGESYPFERDGQYLLTVDNHNSVNGIREYAHREGAPVRYCSLIGHDMRLDDDCLMKKLDKPIPNGNNLFAFPAQSNFTGVKHDLQWVEVAQDKGWDVLLDAAAYTPTNKLDLSLIKPDFVSISFYKIFGYPTGIGALIAKKSKLEKLRRPWFAGGTVSTVTVKDNDYYLEDGAPQFEDGTINYLLIPSIKTGLEFIQDIGYNLIHQRVDMMTDYLLSQLMILKHSNGVHLVQIYGPKDMTNRGGTISFNLIDPNHTTFDFNVVEAMANTMNISLRTGCFCNPGSSEHAFNMKRKDIHEIFSGDKKLYAKHLLERNVKSVGAVRISVGLVTNFSDVHGFIEFAKSFLNVLSDGPQVDVVLSPNTKIRHHNRPRNHKFTPHHYHNNSCNKSHKRKKVHSKAVKRNSHSHNSSHHQKKHRRHSSQGIKSTKP